GPAGRCTPPGPYCSPGPFLAPTQAPSACSKAHTRGEGIAACWEEYTKCHLVYTAAVTRRELLQAGAVAPLLLTRTPRLFAAGYDLVIKGGRVLDPAQRIDRVADVAIRGGKIAAIQPGII